mgnify:CR=1 FL=1
MRFLRWTALAFMLAVPALGSIVPSQAHWLSRIVREAGDAGGSAGLKAGRHGLGALDEAAGHVAKVPRLARGTTLAAHVTPEGHWRFVSREGEVFTAATPAEMARVRTTLAPNAAPDEPLALYLSAETVFARRELLRGLPDADLHLVVGKDAYRLRRPDAGGELVAEFRPNVTVGLGNRALFQEAAFRLGRPLNKASIRVLALEPGGPKRLTTAPRRDPKSGAALVDQIDPALLPDALSGLKGQTALLSGRIEGNRITFRPSRGPEQSLDVEALVRAAEASDVNLVLLQASAAHQPGGRNWLWQRIAVTGLDDAMTRATFADFLSSLGGGGELAIQAATGSLGRVVMTARPTEGMTAPITNTFGPWIGDITGHVAVRSATIYARDASQERELDARIIAGIPAWIQYLYLAAIACGVIGIAVARRWWVRLWPPERREEYSGRVGYWAARVARASAFLLVFLPLAGIPALLWTGLLSLWSLITAPIRGWNWLRGRSA